MAIFSKLLDPSWINNIYTAGSEWLRSDHVSFTQRALLISGGCLTTTVAAIFVYEWLTTPRNLPPGPKGIPLLGAGHLLTEKFYEDFTKLGEIYGDVYSYYLMGRLTVMLNSHSAIKEAFVTMGADFANRDVPKNREIFETEDEIFAADYNDEWVKRKKFAVKALRAFGFGTKKSESMIQLEVKDIITFITDQKGNDFDIQKPLERALANVICSILYSQRYEIDDEEFRELMNILDEMFENMITDFMTLQMVPRWVRKLFYQSRQQRACKPFKRLKKLLLGKIEEHKRTYDENSPPRDFIDMYIHESQELDLDDDRLASTTITFFPDAVRSLAMQIKWGLLYLSLWPEFQYKVQAELDKVCGAQVPSLDHREKLHYTQATIIEILRRSSMFASTAEHMTLNGPKTFRGYNIPADAYVLANIYAVHMNPKVFPEPKVFRPERHLDDQGCVIKNDTMITFGMGRRMCVGEQLAKTEMFLVLSSLLQKFTFSLAEGFDEKGKDLCVMDPPPFMLIAKPRN